MDPETKKTIAEALRKVYANSAKGKKKLESESERKVP